MLEFFTGCVHLFDMTFDAAVQLDFFTFLAGALALQVCFGLFLLFYRGTKKL